MLSCFSSVQFFETPWTIVHQVSLLRGFPRPEHWSGLPCPPPGDLPNPGIEPTSLVSPALSSEFFTTNTTWEAQIHVYISWIKNICYDKEYLLHWKRMCATHNTKIITYSDKV